jgi:hypothetical protein
VRRETKRTNPTKQKKKEANHKTKKRKEAKAHFFVKI